MIDEESNTESVESMGKKELCRRGRRRAQGSLG
jgi:hypothetical protein